MVVRERDGGEGGWRLEVLVSVLDSGGVECEEVAHSGTLWLGRSWGQR